MVDWPFTNNIDYNTFPKPPKTYWTRQDLKDLDPNKFEGICDNHRTLAQVVNKLEVAKVQNCLTPELCESCHKYVEGKTLGAEPVINIFEGIKAQSLRNTCFEGVSEAQQNFNLSCFKALPIIFRG